MGDEEKTNAGEEQTKAEGNVGAGDKSAVSTIIEQTNSAAERLERANKDAKEILQRQEELYAMQRLGGKTEGAIEAVKPAVETEADYAARALKGKI